MPQPARVKKLAIIAAVALAAIGGTGARFRTSAQNSQQSKNIAPGLSATVAAENFSPITIEGDHFVRDGKPYQIISGEMHYARIPHEYWRDRMRLARAMGLNTIQTYAFWNAHEPKPGTFDFSGDLDIAEFLRTAQEENLNVLLRLGPYACAEWDAGGLPAWLFADPSIKVRTTDPKFLEAAGKYLDRIGAEIAPFQSARGGPVFGLQIENEFGSYGSLPVAGQTAAENRQKSREYMEAIRKLFIHAGIGDTLFYTADGTDPEQLADGTLPGVLAVANFGPGEAADSLAKLQKFRPGQPVMNGEYWDGWFDSWGDDHAKTDTDKQVKEITWMLAQGYSFNLYMVHGGTTFGFMNGANFDSGPDGHYAPETTSYDYNAPIDEAGRPTPKYFKFRDAIAEHSGVAAPPMPQNIPVVAVAEFPLVESTSLWKNLPRPISVKRPRSMETFGQSYGYIIYHTDLNTNAPAADRSRDENPIGAENGGPGGGSQRFPGAIPGGSSRAGSPTGANTGASAPTPDNSSSQPDDSLPSAASGDKTHIGRNGGSSFGAGESILAIDDLRDFAAVYIDHKLAGTIDRRLQQSKLSLSIPPGKVALDIVVENTGRVNFGAHLADGQAGITRSVTLGGRELLDWKVYPLPMTSPAELTGWGKHTLDGPAFYRGTFTTDSPADTFLDVSKFGKGFVWVNGHNLGRIWSIGPQQSLYLPGPWLKRGANEVIVFDFARQKHPVLRGVADPIFATPAPVSTRWWCDPNCAPEK